MEEEEKKGGGGGVEKTASAVRHLTPPMPMQPHLVLSLDLMSSEFWGPPVTVPNPPVWALEAADLALPPASFCYFIRVEAK